MKAPDKIYYQKLYINPSGYEEGRAYELNPDPLPCVEYIRKDALLEWLEESKKEMEKELDGSHEAIRFATAIAISSFQEVIDKLNNF